MTIISVSIINFSLFHCILPLHLFLISPKSINDTTLNPSLTYKVELYQVFKNWYSNLDVLIAFKFYYNKSKMNILYVYG